MFVSFEKPFNFNLKHGPAALSRLRVCSQLLFFFLDPPEPIRKKDGSVSAAALHSHPRLEDDYLWNKRRGCLHTHTHLAKARS